MNWASNIINLFSDFYYVSDIEFTKIQGKQLGRLIIGSWRFAFGSFFRRLGYQERACAASVNASRFLLGQFSFLFRLSSPLGNHYNT